MARDFQRPFSLAPGATEVMLIRHGSSRRSTPEAPIPLLDGRSDPPLTEAGERQAEAVGQRLARAPISSLFVTPLRRTHQTAAPLARALGREPTVIDDLREVFLGQWEGQLMAGIADDAELAQQVFATERWDVIPGAESMDGFTARIQRGLERLVETVGPNAVAAAVVHGGVIAEACRQATRSQAFAFLYAENASLTRLMRLPTGRWTLLSFNDTAHLEDRG